MSLNVDSSVLLRFINHLKKSGRSVNTLGAYRNDTALFIKFLNQTSLHPEEHSFQEQWLHYLNENNRKSAASVRRALMSVRTFLHFLVQEKLIQRSPMLEIKSPKQPKHELLIVLKEHYSLLNRTLKNRTLQDNSGKHTRDYVLFLLLGFLGLKATEVCAVKWEDVFIEPVGPHGGEARGTIVLQGRHGRLLEFKGDLVRALENLKAVRQRLLLPHDGPAPLFFTPRTFSQGIDGMHRHDVKSCVYEMCQNIVGVPYNSESLRNFAIKTWIDSGLSSEEVAKLAGYASLNSLERFSRDRVRGSRKGNTGGQQTPVHH